VKRLTKPRAAASTQGKDEDRGLHTHLMWCTDSRMTPVEVIPPQPPAPPTAPAEASSCPALWQEQLRGFGASSRLVLHHWQEQLAQHNSAHECGGSDKFKSNRFATGTRGGNAPPLNAPRFLQDGDGPTITPAVDRNRWVPPQQVIRKMVVIDGLDNATFPPVQQRWHKGFLPNKHSDANTHNALELAGKECHVVLKIPLDKIHQCTPACYQHADDLREARQQKHGRWLNPNTGCTCEGLSSCCRCGWV